MPPKAKTTTKIGPAAPGAKVTARGKAVAKPKGAASKAAAGTKAAKPPAVRTRAKTPPAGTPRPQTGAAAEGATLPAELDAPMLFIEFQGRLLDMHPAAAGEFDSYVWLIETLGAVGGDPVGVLLGAIEARAGTDGLRARLEAVLTDPASASGMTPGADPGDAAPAGPTAGHEAT